MFYNDAQTICGKPNSQLIPQEIKTGYIKLIPCWVQQATFTKSVCTSHSNAFTCFHKRGSSHPGYLRRQVATTGKPPILKWFRISQLLRPHSECSNTHCCVVFCYTLSQEGNKYSTSSSSTTGHLEDANRCFHLLSGGKLQQRGGFPLDTNIVGSPHDS